MQWKVKWTEGNGQVQEKVLTSRSRLTNFTDKLKRQGVRFEIEDDRRGRHENEGNRGEGTRRRSERIMVSQG